MRISSIVQADPDAVESVTLTEATDVVPVDPEGSRTGHFVPLSPMISDLDGQLVDPGEVQGFVSVKDG
jgi:hypothetical protein